MVSQVSIKVDVLIKVLAFDSTVLSQCRCNYVDQIVSSLINGIVTAKRCPLTLLSLDTND